MATTATDKTTITYNYPEWAGSTLTWDLLSSIAINSAGEVILQKSYDVTLDENGEASDDLPTPDSTGDAAWLWRLNHPDGTEPLVSFGYSADTQDAATLLAAEVSTTTASDIAALVTNKQSKDTDAVSGNAAMMNDDGEAVDAGTVFSDLETTTGSQAKADAAQAAAIASLGGADATVSDEQLRNWAGQLPELMTTVTRTDYSDAEDTNSPQKDGCIHVTGVVTWPDGVTGHVDGYEYPQAKGILQEFTASHLASGKIVHQPLLGEGAAGVEVLTPDYYVDSAAAGGGDGSLDTPYNSLAALSTGETLQSGDIIAIKSDSTFLESFDFSDNVPVTIVRYGSGAQPILDARDTISAGSWSAYGAGLGNTYQAAITWTGSSTNISVQHLATWEDDTRAILGSAANNLALGEYYIADPTTGSGTLYFRASDDGDLSAGSSVIKHAKRLGGLVTNQPGTGNLISSCTFDGIKTIGNTHNNGSLVAGESTIIRHCQLTEGTKHNLYYQDGSKLYRCIADNAYNGSDALTQFVYNQGSPTGLGISHDACVVIQDTAYAPAASDAAFHGHINTSGDFGTVTYNQCHSDNVGKFTTAFNSDEIIVTNPYVKNSKVAFDVWNTLQTVYGGFVLHDDSSVTNTQVITSLANNISKFYGLSIRYDEPSVQNGVVYINNAGATIVIDGIEVLESQVISGGVPFVYAGSSPTVGSTLIIKNCYVNTINGRHIDINAPDASFYLASNNNHWVNENTNFRYDGTDYTDFAAWVAGTGQDVGSIAGGV